MKKALFTTALLATFASSSVLAKDVKTIVKNLDVDNGQRLSFSVPVGSLDIQTCNCNEVSMKIKVEAKDSDWSLFSSKDVDDAELSIRERRGGLSFKVDKDDTKQKWVVTLPASSALNVEVGVGHVEIDEFNNDLKADVGVGHINVELEGTDFDRISAETGVGDASIRSLPGDVKHKRAMVSATSRYSGDGKYNLEVEVGVGDIKIRGN